MKKDILEFYDTRSFIDILQEECAELISACSKYKRTIGFGFITACPKQKAFDNLVEEIADVENSIIAIKELLHIDQKDIDKIIYEKDERSIRRIEESKV